MNSIYLLTGKMAPDTSWTVEPLPVKAKLAKLNEIKDENGDTMTLYPRQDVDQFPKQHLLATQEGALEFWKENNGQVRVKLSSGKKKIAGGYVQKNHWVVIPKTGFTCGFETGLEILNRHAELVCLEEPQPAKEPSTEEIDSKKKSK